MPQLPVSTTIAMLIAAVPGAGTPTEVAAQEPRVAPLLVRQQIVVRTRRAPPEPTRWRERKGPRCLAVADLAGALVVEDDAVDLVRTGGERVRARLEDDCPALGFYGGFYLKPMKDGKVCAGRDAIRARSGQMCGIQAFRKLVARR